MKLINFLLWLCAGAIIGWVAGRMAEAVHQRQSLTTDTQTEPE